MRKEAWIAGSVVVAALVAAGVALSHRPDAAVRVEPREIVVATPDGAPRRLDAEAVARILVEKEAAEKERDGLREDKAALEREVARLRAAGAPAESAPAGDGDGEPAAEADLPASIRKTDWNKLGLAVAKLVQADVEGKDTMSDPALMLQMAYLLGRLRAIARELGLEDENEVFYHPKVTARFMRGLSKALFPELADAACEKLVGDLDGVVEEERGRWPERLLPIEKQLRDLELALHLGAQARATLDEAQSERLVRVVGADRPGGYRVSWMAMPGVESLRSAMGDVLATRLDLSGPEAEAARSLGAAMVDRQLAAKAALRAELGEGILEASFGGGDAKPEVTGAPGFAWKRLKARAALIRVQAETERTLHDRLPPEKQRAMMEQPVSLWMVSLGE